MRGWPVVPLYAESRQGLWNPLEEAGLLVHHVTCVITQLQRLRCMADRRTQVRPFILQEGGLGRWL
jgi:hypothetical protein